MCIRDSINCLRQSTSSLGQDLAILDMGCGNSPYRPLFESHAGNYLRVDSDRATLPHYPRLADIPPKTRFDLILLIEVLEHIKGPGDFLVKLLPYLKEDGQIWISVPFSARVHGAPEDYRRWTPLGLKDFLEKNGLNISSINPRGNNILSIINKILYLNTQLLFHPIYFLLGIFMLILLGIPLVLFGQLAVLIPFIDDDPLGYFVVATKK